MLNLLTPGCVLSYWEELVGYQHGRSRNNTRESGHYPSSRSMLVVRSAKIGITVIDRKRGEQESRCPVVNARLSYYGNDIWIAAQCDD
jgi:hypothetical protein